MEQVPYEMEAALDLLAATSRFVGNASDWGHDSRLQCFASFENALRTLLHDFDCLRTHLLERNNLRLCVFDSLPRALAEWYRHKLFLRHARCVPTAQLNLACLILVVQEGYPLRVVFFDLVGEHDI